jgi:septin family protein
MVVGNSGVGKTSFIRTLFGTLQLRASALKSLHKPDPSTSTTSSSKGNITPENRPTSPNSTTGNGIGTKANGTKDSVGYATGPLERTLNSFEALFEIEESSEKINLTMVDTPGFVGTDEVVDGHCDEILAYLEYQFDLTLAEVKRRWTSERTYSTLSYGW